MNRFAQITEVRRASDDDGKGIELVCDPGGGNTVIAEYIQPAGDDSLPLVGDFVAIAEVESSGKFQAVGVNDPVNAGTSANGEVRRYSRNSARVPVAEIRLRSDGSIEINSLAASQPIVIHATGAVQLISDSDDIRLGQGGRKIACVGDLVVGSMAAIAAGGGAPITPTPVTVANACPVVGKIVSGLAGASGG